MQHAGTGVLVTAAQQLEELLADELSVTTELVHDGAASAINEASPHACLVLLQRRPTPASHGVRSVINGVAGRAAVPVVVVPSTWRRDAERQALVVVGVGDAEVSGSLVGTARDMAEEVGADLRIVHTRPEGRRHRSGRRRTSRRRSPTCSTSSPPC